MGKATKNLKLVHEEFSLGVLIHQHVRAAVEQAVHEELAEVLGVELYERSETRRGERNGTKTRTLTGPTGPLELTLPRARLFTPGGSEEWASKLVPRHQRRIREWALPRFRGHPGYAASFPRRQSASASFGLRYSLRECSLLAL